MNSYIIVDWRGQIHFAKYLSKGEFINEEQMWSHKLYQFDIRQTVERLDDDVYSPTRWHEALEMAQRRQLE